MAAQPADSAKRVAGPHQSQAVLQAGEALEKARAAVLLVHGRGADAASILSLTAEIDQAGVAYLAPQPAGSTWYPHPFMMPLTATSRTCLRPWLA